MALVKLKRDGRKMIECPRATRNYYQHSLIVSPNEKGEADKASCLSLSSSDPVLSFQHYKFSQQQTRYDFLGSLEPNTLQNSVLEPKRSALTHCSQNKADEMCAVVEVQTTWFRRSESLTHSNEKIQENVGVWGRKEGAAGQRNHSLNEEYIVESQQMGKEKE